MIKFCFGYLFKKKSVIYCSKEYEIFELIDYVTAICFTNKKGEKLCNILSGNNTGIYSGIFERNSIKLDYMLFAEDFNKVIEYNNNIMDFEEIRKKRISDVAKYYLETADGIELIEIKDANLIKFLEKENLKEGSSFDEDVFEKNTDISSWYSTIKKTIISQDEKIMQILTSIYKNQKVVDSDLDIDLIAKLKENILIYGSTGTGKTEILKRISKLINVPIVIEDATSLSETGYQGRKITDMLEDLYSAANKDIKLAEKGILVIDEFDKLAEKSGDSESHVSRLGVQRSLLKLLDGSLFYFDDKKFDTSRLTVVCVGAFTGITNDDDYKNLSAEDFMQYGIMRELIGRFSKAIAMNSLKKEDIVKILKDSDFSPLNTYKKLFKLLKVNFEFNNDFVDYIADLAISRKSGARSLKTVFDDCISSALFRIFAGEYSSISLIKPASPNGKAYILKKSK